MNQIICTSTSLVENNNLKAKYKQKFLLRLEFFILAITCIIIIIYYLYFRFNLYISEKTSKSLANTYEITKIYNLNENNEFLNEENQIILNEDKLFTIIGIIEIKKINISYPIISDISEEFLKIAPCKIYGPMPNEIR